MINIRLKAQMVLLDGRRKHICQRTNQRDVSKIIMMRIHIFLLDFLKSASCFLSVMFKLALQKIESAKY